MHDVVHDSPGLHVCALDLYEVVVDGVQQQRQRLDYDQHAHQVVDLEHRLSEKHTTMLRYYSHSFQVVAGRIISVLAQFRLGCCNILFMHPFFYSLPT